MTDGPGGGGDETGDLVAAAQGGDVAAVEQLLDSVRDRVYRLSLRMVTSPHDAEDATQEVLLKTLTRLSTFRGQSEFTTWVHRIAVNHLLDRKKSAAERLELTFDFYADDLITGLREPTSFSEPEAEVLAEEVRLGCTQALLTCLDREHRMAYVLGEVFEVSSTEGGYLCDISPAAYRKRLSRARAEVRNFLDGNCGLVNPDRARCRCRNRIETAVELGRISASSPELVNHPAERVRQGRIDMDRLFDAASLLRSHPHYLAPEAVTDRLRQIVQSSEYGLLDP